MPIVGRALNPTDFQTTPRLPEKRTDLSWKSFSHVQQFLLETAASIASAGVPFLPCSPSCNFRERLNPLKPLKRLERLKVDFKQIATALAVLCVVQVQPAFRQLRDSLCASALTSKHKPHKPGHKFVPCHPNLCFFCCARAQPFSSSHAAKQPGRLTSSREPPSLKRLSTPTSNMDLEFDKLLSLQQPIATPKA